MNNPTRNGKIARLPKAIRTAINQRLDEGATAKSLVDWLNEMPEVQAIVQAQFDGHPIREQNLSQWKNGGYREWVQHQGALELAERLYERDEDLRVQGQTDARPPLSDMLSYWLLSRYVQATAEIESADDADAWKLQRQFCDDLAKTRRGEHRAEQLRLERERVELEREELKLKREAVEMTRAGQTRGNGAKAGRRPASQQENGAASEEGAESEPDQSWEDTTDEEKITWARRPENLKRINALTEAQKVMRWKEFLGIPHTPDPDHE